MENNEEFLDAINHDQQVADDINRRCLTNYYHHMNPTLGTLACGCCGRLEIPISNEYLENQRDSSSSFKPPKHRLQYKTYNLHNPILLPLHYTI